MGIIHVVLCHRYGKLFILQLSYRCFEQFIHQFVQSLVIVSLKFQETLFAMNDMKLALLTDSSSFS